jgi:hypothetical protein
MEKKWCQRETEGMGSVKVEGEGSLRGRGEEMGEGKWKREEGERTKSLGMKGGFKEEGERENSTVGE